MKRWPFFDLYFVATNNRKLFIRQLRKSRKRQDLTHMMSVLNRKRICEDKCLIHSSVLNKKGPTETEINLECNLNRE